MNPIFEFLFGQYFEYETIDVVLEIIAVFFGFLSVWFSKQNKIWAFPTGMVSTIIFVYLLFKWGLLGDMMINAYYFVMSIYGWYIWSRKYNDFKEIPISVATLAEKRRGFVLFLITLLFVYLIYQSFDKWTGWVACIDTITTAISFVAMWLMARRKLENWILWIIGDIISVPLYFYRGFTFTSLQYLGFIFIGVFGYITWKKNISKSLQTT